MTINDKNTKAEILEAYKALEKEKKTLESETKNLKKQTEFATKAIAEQPMVKTTQISPKNINQTIEILEQLQIGFGSAVSNLSEQLITEATSLQTLQEDISEERQNLEELHQLEEISEDTLEQLIESYRQNNKNFSEELRQTKENLEQELQSYKQNWEKEKEIHYRNLQQSNQTQQKERQREQEEYEYNLQLTRNLAREEYEQEKTQLQRQLLEEKRTEETQWQEREKNLSEREKIYREAKTKVEIFDKELETKIKKAKDEGMGIGNYQVKIKADLRNMEIEGEKNNYQLRIAALEQTIINQSTRIISLSQQLDMAMKQMQDLAVKAIEGTSNRSSFEAMKEIALEQAKNQPKNK